MAFFRSINPFYCFALTAALVISGCSIVSSGTYNPNRSDSAETLLDAEGEWALVEEKSAPSPIEKHMQTRGKVEPKKLSKSKSYTKHVKNTHVNEDAHFRVLKLEKQMDGEKSYLESVQPVLTTAALPEPATKPKTAKKPQKSASSSYEVLNFRRGEHPGKTRLVLDVSAKPNYKASLDNEHGVLVIEMPGANLSTIKKRAYKKHPLLKGYSVQGNRLVVELKKAVKIPTNLALGPNAKRGHRIVLDLAAK